MFLLYCGFSTVVTHDGVEENREYRIYLQYPRSKQPDYKTNIKPSIFYYADHRANLRICPGLRQCLHPIFLHTWHMRIRNRGGAPCPG